MQFPDIVPLIAGTGVQMLDFGFSVDKTSAVPKDWSFYDPKTQLNNGQPPQIVRRGDEDSTGVESYSVDLRAVFEAFDRVWMPVPLFRKELAGGFFRGPINWARVYVARLSEPGADGH